MLLNLLIRNSLPMRSPELAVVSEVFGVQSMGLINYIQSRGAARKGKRIQRMREARLRAAKRRLLEAQNPKPKKSHTKGVKVDKFQLRFLSERDTDMNAPAPPQDNVYFRDRYRRERYSLAEILEFHRQYVHPDVLNQPDALVSATVDLALKMKIKKKKFIERIASTVCYPHTFSYEVRPRKIVALCRDEADQEAAKEAGAVIAGGTDVLQLLKTNQLTQRDFDHIVCHSDFIVDFAAVKGMKTQSYFPSKQRGNFGTNIPELVKYFKDGVDYSLAKTDDDPSFGYINCYFGRLNMTDEKLQENLETLFESINRFKPLNLDDNKQFFQRVLITTPASEETFPLRFWELARDYVDPETIVIEEEQDAAKAKN